MMSHLEHQTKNYQIFPTVNSHLLSLPLFVLPRWQSVKTYLHSYQSYQS